MYFVFGSDDNLKNGDDDNDESSSSSSSDGRPSRKSRNEKRLKITSDESGFRSRRTKQIRNRRKHNTGKRKFGSEESRNESDDEIDEMFKSDDEEVKEIISDMVADRTKVTYRNANITFLMWIYDGGTYKSRLLREEYIKEMDEAETKKEKRNVSKKWLDGIQCENDCPILLHNLTFKIFSRYLTKRKESSSGRYLSKSTYGSIQSSVCHLY